MDFGAAGNINGCESVQPRRGLPLSAVDDRARDPAGLQLQERGPRASAMRRVWVVVPGEAL